MSTLKTNHLPVFERSLPMSLLRAREAVMKKFIPSLRQHSLSPQQWRVIRMLSEKGEQPMSVIASGCFLLMPSLSRIITNLSQRNLVTKSSDSADQRVFLIALTDLGVELVEKVKPYSLEQYDHIIEQFGEDKLENLYELLKELTNKLND